MKITENENSKEIYCNGGMIRICKHRDSFWTGGGIQVLVATDDEDEDDTRYINLTDEAIDEVCTTLQALKK